MSLTLTMDFQYDTIIEMAWSALADPDKLAEWIMDNDFLPAVGHRFQFRTEPSEWWNGIIEGEVLFVDAPTRLSYTWGVTGEEHTVHWTLEKLENDMVNIHLEQTGISTAEGLEGAKHGWSNWFRDFDKVL